MSNIPTELRFAATHEWLKILPDGQVEIGITDFAQQELGDLVYIELPEVGRSLQAKEQCAVVESVKTASDLYAPLSGSVTAVNVQATDEPGLVNDQPYATWLFRMQAENLADANLLLDAAAYKVQIEG